MNRYQLLSDDTLLDAIALENGLASVADSIREKTGVQGKLIFPDQFNEALTEAVDYPFYMSYSGCPGYYEIKGKAYCFSPDIPSPEYNSIVYDIVSIEPLYPEIPDLVLNTVDGQKITSYDCIIVPKYPQLLKEIATNIDTSSYRLPPGIYTPISNNVGTPNSSLTWYNLKDIIELTDYTTYTHYDLLEVESAHFVYTEDDTAGNGYRLYFSVKCYTYEFSSNSGEWEYILQTTLELPFTFYNSPNFYERISGFKLKEAAHVHPELKQYFDGYTNFSATDEQIKIVSIALGNKSSEAQTIYPDAGYTSLHQVVVSVSSNIDKYFYQSPTWGTYAGGGYGEYLLTELIHIGASCEFVTHSGKKCLKITPKSQDTIIYFQYKVGNSNGYIDCICPCHFGNLTKEEAHASAEAPQEGLKYFLDLYVEKDNSSAYLSGYSSQEYLNGSGLANSDTLFNNDYGICSIQAVSFALK